MMIALVAALSHNLFVLIMVAIVITSLLLVGFTIYLFLKRSSRVAEERYQSAKKRLFRYLNYPQRELFHHYEQTVFYEPNEERARALNEKLIASFMDFQLKAFILYNKALNARLNNFLLSIKDRRGRKHYALRKALP